MKNKLDNLNNFVLKFYRINFSDLKSHDIEEIRASIDDFINHIFEKHDDRLSLTNAIESSLFHDIKLNIIHIIAKFGTVEQLKKIIEMIGISIVNSLDVNQYCALHYASIHGRLDIVKELIDNDADKDAITSQETRKWHAIHFASRYGNLSIVKYLIEIGVNKEIRTGFGLTPLHVACEFGRIEIAKYLLSIGVYKDPITIDENQNMTPLHYAVVGNFLSLTDLLLVVGCDINKLDLKGFSSLDISAKNNLSQMTFLLLKWGPKNIESSYQIAQFMKCLDSSEILARYLNAKKCLFNKKILKKLTAEIYKMMIDFNGTNLSEGKIKIFGNVEFNAFGIMNLTHQIGFFKKIPVEFSQFVKNIENLELCDGIDHIDEVIMNDHSELINLVLANV